MFPYIHCDFEDTDFLSRSMWWTFLEQREEQAHLNESGEEFEDEPEPTKSKSASRLKGKSVDFNDDSPVRAPEPPTKQQSWEGDAYYHHHVALWQSTLHVADVRQSRGRDGGGSFRHRTRESISRLAFSGCQAPRSTEIQFGDWR